MINYALDTLINERDVLRERVGIKKDSLKFFKKEVTADVMEWEAAARQIDATIHFIQANRAKIKAALGDNGKIRKGTKHLAKCGDKSYTYCISKCKSRKNKSCDLVRYKK